MKINWRLVVGFIASCVQAAELHFYVAPDGNDANAGTLASPFQTLTYVQTHLRTIKATFSGQITVHLRQGLYRLTEPLVFTDADSGNAPDAPIIYKSYCDPIRQQILTKITEYPYIKDSIIPLRSIWNGVGNQQDWTGPGSTSEGISDPSEFCMDRDYEGHVCYQGEIASCLDGCSRSCQEDIDKETYTTEFYDDFYYLFGKDLRREEDCLEICATACTACEDVTITGLQVITPTWTIHSELAELDSSGETIKVYVADFTAATTMDTLVIDGKTLERARFDAPPDALLDATPDSNGLVLAYDSTDLSTRAASWSNIDRAQVVIFPRVDDTDANLVYSISGIDTVASRIQLASGGGQISETLYFSGPFSSTRTSQFYIENILEELDAQGEWYYDPEQQKLYVCPLDGVDLTAATIEYATLVQIIVVHGTQDSTRIQPGHGVQVLYEELDDTPVENLVFDGLRITGTRSSHMDTFERTANNDWTLTRSAAMYFETVKDITVRRCTLEKLAGNALMVYGQASNVEISNNDIHQVGMNGISIVPKSFFRVNSYREPVLSRFLFSKHANVSFNRVFEFGQTLKQSAAILLIGNSRTTREWNLIHDIPSGAVSYRIVNPDGQTATQQLLRPIDPIVIPETLATTISALHTIVVPVTGFDTKLIVKIIGSPDCASGNGRIAETYGAYHTQCSGCCPRTSTSAKLRRQSATPVDWADTTDTIELLPGESFELEIQAPSVWGEISQVFLSFHRVTRNGIIDLYGSVWRSSWTVRTRQCVFASNTYSVSCSGPCGCNSTASDMTQNGLVCNSGDLIDSSQTQCDGPFDAWSDCDATEFRTVLYYNCHSLCTTTSCT